MANYYVNIMIIKNDPSSWLPILIKIQKKKELQLYY